MLEDGKVFYFTFLEISSGKREGEGVVQLAGAMITALFRTGIQPYMHALNMCVEEEEEGNIQFVTVAVGRERTRTD